MELALRIQKEIRAWWKLKGDLDKRELDKKAEVQHFSLIQIMAHDDDDLMVFVFFFPADCDSLEKKYLKVQMEIPDSYPDLPPKFKFLTPMWHPNVSLQDGEVLPGFIQHDWSISPCISRAVLALWSLINSPDLEHAVEQRVSQQFLRNRKSYIENSLAWMKAFACSFPEEKAGMVKLGKMLARFEDGRYPVARKGLAEELAKIETITIQQESDWTRVHVLMSNFPSFRPHVKLSHLLGRPLQDDLERDIVGANFEVEISKDDIRDYYYSGGQYLPLEGRD